MGGALEGRDGGSVSQKMPLIASPTGHDPHRPDQSHRTELSRAVATSDRGLMNG